MYNLTRLEAELLQRLDECESLVKTLNELLLKANGYKYHYNAEKLFYNKPEDIYEMKYTDLFDVLLITKKEYEERFTLKEENEKVITIYDKKEGRDVPVHALVFGKAMSNFGRSIVCRSNTGDYFFTFDGDLEVYIGFIKSVKIREREFNSYKRLCKSAYFEKIKIEI
jgi:hypothetical protein